MAHRPVVTGWRAKGVILRPSNGEMPHDDGRNRALFMALECFCSSQSRRRDQELPWRLINAGSETVGTVAALKKAFAKRRCLVPVDGFYEWNKVGRREAALLHRGGQ